VRAQLQCIAKPVALMGLPPVSEVCRRMNSLAADANPTPFTLVAAHAASVVAQGKRTPRTVSTAPITHAKATAHGK